MVRMSTFYKDYIEWNPNQSNEDKYGSSPKEYVIYQPNPAKQILLYDLATSYSVQIYLRMNNIPYTIKNQSNAEFMSENGRLPVVFERDNDKPMCGFKEVFWRTKNRTDYKPFIGELACLDWVETGFLEAEMFLCWCHEPLLNEYTKIRYTYDLSWPISSLLLRNKRQQMQSTLSRRFMDFKDFSEKFNNFLSQLSKILGNRDFCKMEEPCVMNALIYGHASAILQTDLHPKIVEAIKWHKRIENFVRFIDEHYPNRVTI